MSANRTKDTPKPSKFSLDNIKTNGWLVYGLREKLFVINFFSYTYNPTRRFYSTYHKSVVEDAKELRARAAPQVQAPRRVILPRMKNIFYAYYVISTVTHIFSMFHALVLIMIYESQWGFKLHHNCYLPGRLSMHEDAVRLMPYFQIISSALHIIWRYLNVYYEVDYRLDGIIFLMADLDEYQRQTPSSNGSSPKYNYAKKKPNDNHLNDILYLEIEFHHDRSEFHLRPNRTARAREELTDIINQILFWCSVISLVLFCIIYPNIMLTSLFDTGYIKNYPSCMPDLETLNAQGQLSAYSITFWPPNHRLASLGFDFLINFYVYIDDLMAMLMPASLSLVLTSDLMIYWRDIDSKLNKLLQELKTSDGVIELKQTGSFASSKWMIRSLIDRSRQHAYHRDELDKEIHIIQRQIMDFFKQLRYYDKYVSLLITFLFQIWITMFIATSYMSIKLNSINGLFVIRIIQIYGCAALSGPVYALLRLRRYTKDTYPVLCGIMAYEKLPKRKMSWLRVIEFYTYKERYGFSLLHRFPLTWMSFLKCIATSVSFLIVIETFKTL